MSQPAIPQKFAASLDLLNIDVNKWIKF